MAKGKILIIDDEKIFLEAHREEIEEAGHEVKIALSGKEAIALARKEKFNIVFVDLVMPEMNGVEVCKEIKKISPKTEVTLISGHPEEIRRYEIDFITAGGREEWLRKPLGEDELSNVAEKILKEMREKRED